MTLKGPSGDEARVKEFRARIRSHGKEVICIEGETLLEALMKRFYGREGRGGFYGCRRGGCGVCKARLVAGVVEHANGYSRDALTDKDRDAGYILLCRSRPATDVELNLEEKVSAFYRFYAQRAEKAR